MHIHSNISINSNQILKNKLNFLLIMILNSINFTLSKLAGLSIETQKEMLWKNI